MKPALKLASLVIEQSSLFVDWNGATAKYSTPIEVTIDNVGKPSTTIFDKLGHHQSSRSTETVSLTVCCWDPTVLSLFLPSWQSVLIHPV